jgi:N-sulfoglucosamine sulfohydrolase
LQGAAFLGAHARPGQDYIFAARDRMDETYDVIRAVRDSRYKYIRNFQPEKPYAQYIDYMDQMPTLKEWRRLNKEGLLTGPQALFFQPTKPEEELYDTQSDPHEVVNLAGQPEHAATLTKFRERLARWQKETGDLGLIPEPELKERMRPGGVWQVTADPIVTVRKDAAGAVVEARCETDGASLVYTTEAGPRPRWKLLTGPVTVNGTQTVRVKANRLGYRDSAEAIVTTGQ